MSESQGEPSGLGDEESLSVLLAEDNLGDARLFEEYLSESPVEVDVRHEKTLRACLGTLGEEKPDVLALDLGLPDSEGAETVKAAAAAAPEVPIVVLTGQDGLEVALQAQEAGAAEYLQKDELTPALAGRTLRWAVQQGRMQSKLQARSAAMQTSIDGMAILGPNERYRFANQAHADIYGYEDPETFLGETWRMCYGEAERTRFEEKIFPLLRETGSWRGEALGQRRDGTTFPQEVSLTLTEEGHVVGVVRDITDRKERELRREAVFENTYQLTGLMDLDGTLVEANETALAFVGADRDEAVGKPLWETPWFQASDKTVEIARRSVEAARGGEFYRDELPIEDANGEVAVFDYSVRPVRDEAGEVAVLVPEGRNITERVERERELERKNARLDSFAGLVSHDLRNPLNVATGRLRLAQEEDGDPSAHLDAVTRALRRMDAVIEDVLTLTWSGRDIGSEDLATRDLAPLAEASWDQVGTAGATLRLDDPPRRLRCDENRVRRLLENLFRNAIEHAGEAATVRVGGLPGGFYVEDDGPGLPEGSHESIFEAGYSSNDEGTGLGLSIVKSIAETHGWTLTAAESPSGGARFEFRDAEVAGG